ncbi:heavy metal translocating P-type ATPase [Halolamina sp.]|uniref:heavy metal translocating P-type ATPase n=1 Tax=Halolamina sp. TaxID=1940283 RepID=UPI0035685A0D
MQSDRTPAADASETCRLCGSDLSTRRRDAGDAFCSEGCRDVDDRLPAPEVYHDQNAGPGEQPPTESDEDSVFLTVEGMHSTTCESFLESVAMKLDGVRGAEASYVTESIRVTYDSTAVTDPDGFRDMLVEELSVLGYSAASREKGTAEAAYEADIEDVIGYRYAAGVVFTSFLMIPYLVVFYPAHFADLFGLEYNLFAAGNQALVVLPAFLILTIVVMLFTGAPVLRDAYVALKLRQPNTGLLVTMTALAAYLFGSASFVAGGTGVYYDLTVVSVATVTGAMFYESVVKRRAADALTDLTISRVRTTLRYASDGSTVSVDVDTLETGDLVLVPEGERIPVDGTLVEGECTVDEAVVTGESTPVRKQAGDTLIGGSVLVAGAADLRVGEDATSSIDRLTAAVWGFQTATHGAQRRADELATKIVPALAGLSVLVGVATVLVGGDLPAAAVAVLTVVLVGSPWVLGFATPFSTGASIEAALDRGIAVFDETVFERLRAVDTVVFDKTGTLTTGQMELLETDLSLDLFGAVAALERRAAHPAAAAIVAAYDRQNDAAAAKSVTKFTSHGTGVEGVVDDDRLLVGTVDLFAEQGWSVPSDISDRAVAAHESGNLPVVVGRNGTAEGLVLVGDEPRVGWEETLADLSERGLETVVLTGDDAAAAEAFTDSEHVDYVFAEVPPSGKAATVRRLQADGREIAMVGDGTNDAPALAAADLGLSLGSGTALAADAADLALVEDDLATVDTAFGLSATAAERRRQNVVAALSYNAIVAPTALVGILNPLVAMFGALVSCGLVVANSHRTFDDGD